MTEGPSIESVAAALSFDLDPEELRTCLGVADGLADLATDLEPMDSARETGTQEATGSGSEAEPPADGDVTVDRSDDPYNALLAVYDTPRRETRSGALADLTVAVKDNTAVAALPMTCGDEGLNYTPSFDATVVKRLLAAGAPLVGKANMDAFAFGPSGEFSAVADVRNPIATGRVPGGSSSGSGAAVAAGLVDVALGTDTGGSIRIPAACCGLAGIKPTTGRVPLHGIVPFAPSLDTVGPLAGDLSTAARVLDVLLGSDDWDGIDGPGAPRREDADDLRFVMPRGFFERSEDVVAGTVREVARELDDRPAVSVRSIDPGFDLDTVEDAYFLVGATEFAWWIRQHGVVRGHGATYEEGWRRAFRSFVEDGRFSDHVAKRVLPAAYLDARERGRTYAAGRRTADAFSRRLARLFEDGSLLVLPTIRTLPPERGTVTANDRLLDLLGNTAVFNMAGTPAVSVPVAEVNGLPVSAQVVGPRFADERTIEGATRVAEVGRWSNATPE
jgi:Asp-tRNA(Asn)/Glu-tRNA(Gln) amidotransferase A subunit family amidase